MSKLKKTAHVLFTFMLFFLLVDDVLVETPDQKTAWLRVARDLRSRPPRDNRVNMANSRRQRTPFTEGHHPSSRGRSYD
jgi:hypothetical protein